LIVSGLTAANAPPVKTVTDMARARIKAIAIKMALGIETENLAVFLLIEPATASSSLSLDYDLLRYTPPCS
jgi:hypothetical protein